MKKIVYIAGSGHSGSTICDIVLGGKGKVVNTGELMFLAEKVYMNGEYCSCGVPVPVCAFWIEVEKKWAEGRFLPLNEYNSIQFSLNRKKNFLKTRRKLKNPDKTMQKFIDDTRLLYESIFSVSGAHTLIDSSKSAMRIMILNKLGFDLTVVHLIRRFGDVLNSNKKKAKKNLEAGIEHDVIPKKTSFMIISWVSDNLMVKWLANKVDYVLLKYERLVHDPKVEISRFIELDTDYSELLQNRGPFKPGHMAAGNANRMKSELWIAKRPMNTSYSRLSGLDRWIAKSMDLFYTR
jgi:hypothetical protein